MARSIVKYNQGNTNNTVAFIFACPGQKELKINRVLAGTTGNNLDNLLIELNKLCSITFPFTDRYQYLLTNASEQVYFKGYQNSNRTLPLRRTDVYTSSNETRLVNEIKTKKIIIAFGDDATIALTRIKNQLSNCILIHYDYHLGIRGINNISFDISGKQILPKSPNATQQRLQVIAYKIWDAIQKGGNL